MHLVCLTLLLSLSIVHASLNLAPIVAILGARAVGAVAEHSNMPSGDQAAVVAADVASKNASILRVLHKGEVLAHSTQNGAVFLDWMLVEDESVADGHIVVPAGDPIAAVESVSNGVEAPLFVRAPITGTLVRTLSIRPGDQLLPGQVLAVMQARMSTTAAPSQASSDGPDAIASKPFCQLINIACAFLDIFFVVIVAAGLWWTCTHGQGSKKTVVQAAQVDVDPVLYAERQGVLAKT